LALKELPPERQGSLEVRYEDDSFLPKNTVSAFTKLASVDKASVIIGFGSATGNAISKLSEERGITFVSISSDPAVSRGKKNLFTFWVTPEAETTAVFEEAAKRSIKNIARITVVHDGAIAVKDAMDKMNKGNLTLAFDEDIAGDQKDFRPLLGRMRSKTFDVFVPLVFPEQLGIFARQAKEMGFTQPCVGYEMFEDENAVKLSNGALIGSWYATYDDGDSGFLGRYKAAYPGASTIGAANGYDSVGIINAALIGNSALDDSKSTSKISAHFQSLKNFQGALGTYSATGDNRFSLPAAIKVVTESGFKKNS
jgi:branched-chain amino acid transport system substrate-binding protein